MINKIRSLVRPLITLMFSAAFILAAFYRPDAVDKLLGLATMVVGWWFASRTPEKK